MISILKKLRPYTLLIAITSGLAVFLLGYYVPAVREMKAVGSAVGGILPVLIFAMLFLAFSKINLKEMKPKKWQYILLFIQTLVASALALFIHAHPDFEYAVQLKGIIVCFITPTACAAAVLTGRLGGNESAITSYILLSHVLAAFVIPMTFPLISDRSDMVFTDELLNILSQTFPIIGFPLISAIIIRLSFKKLHQKIVNISSVSFYLWAFTVFVLSAQTFWNIANAQCSALSLYLMAATGLLCTIMQFCIGKCVGQFEGQRISAGQGLGQKNMLFGTWSALSYLNPTVAIIPGTYILWQNLMNAWQMSHREKLLKIWKEKGTEPYQE